MKTKSTSNHYQPKSLSTFSGQPHLNADSVLLKIDAGVAIDLKIEEECRQKEKATAGINPWQSHNKKYFLKIVKFFDLVESLPLLGRSTSSNPMKTQTNEPSVSIHSTRDSLGRAAAAKAAEILREATKTRGSAKVLLVSNNT